MEQWVSLEKNMVHARFKVTYTGTITHAARHQEIPAIFVDASLASLVTYSGDAPWTGGEVIRRNPGNTNEYYKITENWVAYVDERDFGVGAYIPIASDITCYRFRGGAGSDCSYVAPIATFALKPGLEFEYDAYFAIGSVIQLREQFSVLRKTLNQK